MSADSVNSLVDLRVLGPPQVRAGGELVHIQRKRFALLSYLALTPETPQERDTLLRIFWPDSPSMLARTSLRQALSGLRKALSQGLILSPNKDQVGISPEAIRCDALQFDRHRENGELDKAVELYGGPLLEGFYLKDCRDFEDWVDWERTRLARAAAESLEQLARSAEAQGEHRMAIDWWLRLVKHDPYRGSAVVQLMRALEMVGERASALRVAEHHVAILKADLDAEPDPLVVSETQRIKRAPVSPSPVDHKDDSVRVPPRDPDPLHHLRESLSREYAIERQIGRGGMAKVYLATDLREDRPVALKVLRPELAAAVGSERFAQEVRILTTLHHPHILQLLHSGEAAGLPYYVTPYVAGESLDKRLLRDPQLSIDEALGIAADVATALGHAHEHGIIHRDIKPENILLVGDQALVADFGIARIIDDLATDELSGSGIILGTPQYMSPEQAEGHQADARSDLYSLGCVLFEMLAGSPPYSGGDGRTIAAQHMGAPVPSVRERRHDVSLELTAAVNRLLQKDPRERFQSAGALVDALRDVQRVPSPGRTLDGDGPAASAGFGIVSDIPFDRVRQFDTRVAELIRTVDEKRLAPAPVYLDPPSHGRRWAGASIVLLVLAAVAVMPRIMATGQLTFMEYARALQIENPQAIEMAWDSPGWSVTRGPAARLTESQIAFRLGVRLVDLTVAVELSDGQRAIRLLAEHRELVRELILPEPALMVLSALERGVREGAPADTLRPLLARYEEQLRDLVSDGELELGQWVGLGRLAVAIGDSALIADQNFLRNGREAARRAQYERVERSIESLITRGPRPTPGIGQVLKSIITELGG